MSDRHEKWVRVEPGTVIPAGQPYRTESRSGLFIDGATSCQFANGQPKAFKVDPLYDGAEYTMRVDSSWKPPPMLPTEPTWGIAVHEAGSFTDQWFTVPERPGRLINGRGAKLYVASVHDFIPLTDEQIQRIEAAR